MSEPRAWKYEGEIPVLTTASGGCAGCGEGVAARSATARALEGRVILCWPCDDQWLAAQAAARDEAMRAFLARRGEIPPVPPPPVKKKREG